MANRHWRAPRAASSTSISRFPNHYLSVYGRPGIYLHGNAVSATAVRDVTQRFKSIKLQADGEYLLVHADAERVSNIPTATIERSAAIEFRTNANDRLRTYIKNIVVSVGVDKLYDSLVATGEFTTRGILFDVDSAAILPASTPTLAAILDTLKAHADLALIVEGHTDSTGDDGHNLQLSLRRAEAVVAQLIEQGIDGKQLRAAGKGETEPAADNATPEGRAQNRRVVLRRIEG